MIPIRPGHRAPHDVIAEQHGDEVRVTIVRTGEWVPLEPGDPDPPAPPQHAPAVLVGTPTVTAIVWSWSPVADATGYAIEYGEPGGDLAVTDTGDQLGFFQDDLRPETTYGARVYAYNTAGPGPKAAFVQVTTLAAPVVPQPPKDAPANLAGDPAPDAIVWTWEAVADATGYVIEAGPKGGPYAITDTGAVTEHLQDGLDPDTVYEARVWATNAAGDGPESDFVAVRPPPVDATEPPDDPLAVPDLLLAIDPARSPMQASGGRVVSIDDLGPAGRRYAQPQAARRPTLEADGVRGGPALRGDGERVLWTDAAAIWGGFRAPRAIYALVRAGPQPDRQLWAEASTLTTAPVLEVGSDPVQTDRLRVYMRDDQRTVVANVATSRPVFDGSPHVVCVTWDDRGFGRIVIDGEPDAEFSVAAVASLTRSALLGIQREGEPAFMLSGFLGPLYVYAAARTPDQAAVVEGYLASYGDPDYEEPAEPEPPPGALTVELYRWLDFELAAPGVSGNRYDVEGEVVWTHQPTGATRTSRVWYTGAGDLFRYRFGAALPGTWTGTTSSPVAALNGINLAAHVVASSNPRRTGWSGQIPGQPQAWARQKGPDGALVKRTPQLAMLGQPRYWWNNLAQMRSRVADLLDGHGFTAIHVPVIGSQWFDVTRYAALPSGDANPDPRTFAAIEALAAECSDRGAWLKFWMWGKTTAGEWQRLSGGYNGAVARRIHRYVAARLGPVPGWWAGIGYDCEFWMNFGNPAQPRWWLDELSSRFGGWHHWLSIRYSDSDVGAGMDPEPANKGEFRARGVTINTLRSTAVQAADWEQWAALTLSAPNHPKLNQMLTVTPGRPTCSGDRFRNRENGWPQKDMPNEAAVLSWLPPFQSRGIAAIWGHLTGTGDEGSGTFPNRGAIKEMMDDLDEDPHSTTPPGGGSGGGNGSGNDTAPALGVFTHGETIKTAPFAELTGLPVTIWETFLPRETWADVESPGWKINPLAVSMRERPDVLVVYGQPPFARTEGWGREGLEKGAAGAYNAQYANLARRLKNVGIVRLVIRFGWEWNGGWYAWGVQGNNANAQMFAQMWRHFVTVVNNEHPTNRYLYNWNPTQDIWPSLLEAAWPGADVVDLVGIDAYDENWWSVHHGRCDRFDYACRWRDTAERIGWLKAHANKYGKPLSFDEWGVWGDVNDQRGAGDNAYYIERMAEFILNPENRVAYSVYFDVRAAGDHRLEAHPQALAAFRSRMRAAGTARLGHGLD